MSPPSSWRLYWPSLLTAAVCHLADCLCHYTGPSGKGQLHQLNLTTTICRPTWHYDGAVMGLFSIQKDDIVFGGWAQGVEPASCYWQVAGLIPLVCMSVKCPWTRYRAPNRSRCAGRHLAWQLSSSVYECMNYCKSLWTKASDKCLKMQTGELYLIQFLSCECCTNPAFLLHSFFLITSK